MAIKIYGMLDSDFMELGGEVKDSLNKDAHEILSSSLTSPRIFGVRSKRGNVYQSMATANMRGYIRLCVPVFNKFLLRHDGGHLRKVLGIPSGVMSGLLDYTLVYDKSSDSLVSASEIEDVSNMLCGPEYILKLIDEFDINEAIVQTFKYILEKKFKLESTAIDHNSSGEKLIGNWYAHFEDDNVTNIPRCELLEYFANVVFANDASRLSILLSLKSKRPLESMIQRFVTVLPKAMRPSIGKMHDPLTCVYADIISCNQDLILLRSSNYRAQEYVLKYKKLNDQVSFLEYKSDIKKEGRKSIEEILKTKHGHVRGNMLGKRQDCSGRATVIINPDLPLDTIRIPVIMLPKLYRYHLLKEYGNDIAGFNSLMSGSPEMILKRLTKKRNGRASILESVPAVMGRHPTLHHLSVLAFHVEPTQSHAIEVSPLICTGYNMDFDGDTTWLKIPMSAAAVAEAWNLMLASQNLFTQKDGVCSVVPKQDMIYGLYKCTQKEYKLGKSVRTFQTLSDVKEAVMCHAVKVYDTVTVAGVEKIAGYAAFESCFPKAQKIEVREITKKSIKSYINDLVEFPTKAIISSLNQLVSLGFQVAKLYSPSMSIFTTIDKKKYVDQFMEDIKEPLKYYDIGFMDDDSYTLAFDEAYDKMTSGMLKEVKDTMDRNNGFISMARCGARGDDSNLQQVFACKGKIVKGAGEAFNCVIEKSYLEQLTSFEHFLTAYGGRRGLIDKTLTTGDPGYLGRKTTHTTQRMVITSKDCGTKEGITISKRDIINSMYSIDWYELNMEMCRAVLLQNNLDEEVVLKLIELHNDELCCTFQIGKTTINKQLFLESRFGVDFSAVNAQFENMIVGRYIFSNDTSIYVTRNTAREYAESLDEIVIRSPLTCKKPCCVKCYGEDLGNHKTVAIGTTVGIIAAQSISEPGTQMTMNQFHLGGVAKGGGDMSSSFDRLETYLEVRSFQKKPTYEPLAWATGEVIEVSTPDYKRVKISGDSKKYIRLPVNAKLKKYVTKGEGMCVTKGDNSVSEMVEYCGLKTAQIRLMHILYELYKAEGAISSKHFEVIIAMMTTYTIIDTNRPDLRIGQKYQVNSLMDKEDCSPDFVYDSGEINGTIYKRELCSVRTLPVKIGTALSKFMLEDMGRGLSKDVIFEMEDNVESPLQRMLVGLQPHVGTYYPDYIDERRRL